MGGRSGSGRIRVNGGVVGRAEFESRDGLFFVGEGGGVSKVLPKSPSQKKSRHPKPSPTTTITHHT